jgi:hypothetical protein
VWWLGLVGGAAAVIVLMRRLLSKSPSSSSSSSDINVSNVSDNWLAEQRGKKEGH